MQVEAVEIIRMSEKTPLRDDQIGIVNAVMTAVTRSIELDVVLKTALSAVMEAFEVSTGAIYLVDLETGRLVLKVSEGLSPAFRAEKSDMPAGTGCAGWAVDHGKIFSAFGAAETPYICEDAERLLGLDCLLASPIMTKRRVHGVIELFAPASRRLTEEEGVLIKVISDQIGIAIENARLYEESRQNVVQLTELKSALAGANKRLQAHLSQESKIAQMLQKSLLPRRLPRIEGIEIAARLISATEAADVGGDFYDLAEIDQDLLAIMVGDVCGSGIEAATLNSMAKNTIRAFAWEDRDVSSILTRANRVIHAQTDVSKFVTLFLGLLDLRNNQLSYCVAGQPLPLVLGRDGQVRELEPGSMALGIDPSATYDRRSLQLVAGDTLLIFTDGLVEARRDDALFGEDRVKGLLVEKAGLPLDDLLDEILSAAGNFSGGRLRDDVALVSLRLKP
jgi:serine phosphatase RsbU (regulator of sigma subunit)